MFPFALLGSDLNSEMFCLFVGGLLEFSDTILWSWERGSGGLRPIRRVARPAPRLPGAAPIAGWGKCPPRQSGALSLGSAVPAGVGPQLLLVGHWEGREGQDVRRGIRHLGKELPELFHHSVQLAVDLGRRQLLVDGAADG